jgi:hypothetical protein
MQMNKIFFGAAAIVIIAALASVQLESFAQPATNMTGGIESKLKAAQPEGGIMEATAPGDLVYVLICPQDFDNVVEDCQVFQGRPVQ